MPQTLLVHFVSDFLRDPDLRARVLKDEDAGSAHYGLSAAQIQVMKTFDKTTILNALYDELLSIGIDMDAKKNEVHGGGGGAGGGGVAMANLYTSGGIHPRKVIPSAIQANTDFKVTIAGNGFDKFVAVRFNDGNQPPVTGKVVSIDCDLDLYQRLEVEVKLPAGTYTIEARNAPGDPWTSGGTGNPVSVQLTVA